jgi:NAD-dependent DNA ligase
VTSLSTLDRPFTGQHVAVLGRLSLLSKRDARVLVERLGGAFSSAITPRTTMVIAGVKSVAVQLA